jgi:hypothetical protein
MCPLCAGDQVLEWNGVKLTGKTYEDVQQIINQTNGEIELVVRAYVFLSVQFSSKREIRIRIYFPF